MKKVILLSSAALITFASIGSAEAQRYYRDGWRGGYYHNRGWNNGGAVAAGAAGTDRDTDEAEPRRGRSRGGRGKGAAKPEKVPSRPAPAAEARPTRSSRDDRKPRHDEPDGPDDGWNGPMPGFLSVGFGN